MHADERRGDDNSEHEDKGEGDLAIGHEAAAGPLVADVVHRELLPIAAVARAGVVVAPVLRCHHAGRYITRAKRLILRVSYAP